MVERKSPEHLIYCSWHSAPTRPALQDPQLPQALFRSMRASPGMRPAYGKTSKT